jgi:hypothetical protein
MAQNCSWVTQRFCSIILQAWPEVTNFNNHSTEKFIPTWYDLLVHNCLNNGELRLSPWQWEPQEKTFLLEGIIDYVAAVLNW